MGRKRMKGCKYQRVSQQQKYIFLKLCITEQQSIHEAAFHAGIQYSTAKTILFFHKKNYKNYSSYHVPDPRQLSPTSTQQASWKAITIDLEGQSSERQSIEIIVDSKAKLKENRKQGPQRKKNFLSEEDENNIKVEHESREIFELIEGEVKNEEVKGQEDKFKNNQGSIGGTDCKQMQE